GNVGFTGPITLGAAPPSGWSDIGFGLAGGAGIPTLAGTGNLDGGCPASLDLSGAAPSAAAVLFISFSSTPVGFKGGTLAASPAVLTIPFVTSGAGSIPLPFLFPTG